MKLLIVALLLICCSCAQLRSELLRDPGTTSYDPPAGHSLFEQIPNNTNNADRCCGDTYPNCEWWQTPRC